MKEKIKKILCVMLVGVMITSTGLAAWEAVGADSYNNEGDWVREPEYENSYGRCWGQVWKKHGYIQCVEAVTESFYSYGTSTKVVLTYKSGAKYLNKVVSDSTLAGSSDWQSSAKINKAGVKASCSCGAYRVSWKDSWSK